MPRIALLARVVYGARNAWAPLASALEAEGLLGEELRIHLVDGAPFEEAERLRSKGWEPVILYGVSSIDYLWLRGEIREAAKRYRVIAGGPHAEGAYWHLLRDGVYAAVVGDGEAAIVELARHLLGDQDISRVPNIAYRENGRFRVTRNVLVDLDSYKPHYPRLALYPPIEIMRGCPYKCRFCQVPWLFKATVRYRSIEAVAEAVRDYVAAGKRRIRFIAPVGFAYQSREEGRPNPEAIEELLLTVRRLGGEPYLGSFPSETRPEYVTREVLEVVRKYAANRRVSVGLQSGSNRLLEAVGRGHTVEEALEAVDLILEYGLTPVVDIIFGLPGETREDVEATVKVMFDLAGKKARLRLHTFLPLPGTPLARARPKPVHDLYRKAVLKLLGRGVLEGDWEDQEKLAPKIYCLIARDPAPTPEPMPLPGAESYCGRVESRPQQ